MSSSGLHQDTFLDIRSLVLGTNRQNLRNPLKGCSNFNGSKGDELIMGVDLNNRSRRSAVSDFFNSLDASNRKANVDHLWPDTIDIPEGTRTFNGMLAKVGFPEQASVESQSDFTVDLTNSFEATDMAYGDLNNDGLSDLVLASSATCDVALYYGVSGLGVSITRITDPDLLNCNSTFEDLAIGDVTGDGIDDLIMLFPGEDGNGQLAIVAGTNNFNQDDFTLANAIYINGSRANPLGNSILLVDTDGDGIFDIVTNDDNGDNAGIVNAAGIVGEAEGVYDGDGDAPDSAGGYATGCELKTNQTQKPYVVLFILLFIQLAGMVLWRGRRSE